MEDPGCGMAGAGRIHRAAAARHGPAAARYDAPHEARPPVNPSPIEIVATALFALAVVHTFSTKYFQRLAARQPAQIPRPRAKPVPMRALSDDERCVAGKRFRRVENGWVQVLEACR